MDRSHSPSTWRNLGRRAFHTAPDYRCLPPLDDPEAVRAWSEGYRLAWCAWHDRLPTSPVDQLRLETDLQRALKGGDQRRRERNGTRDQRARARLH